MSIFKNILSLFSPKVEDKQTESVVEIKQNEADVHIEQNDPNAEIKQNEPKVRKKRERKVSEKPKDEIVLNEVKVKTLYDYQKEAVSTTDEANVGKVILPTGTGKSLVQSAIICKDIIKHDKGFNVYVVNAPRIMLSYQLLKDTYSYLTSNGIEFFSMFVHSGGKTDKKDLEEMRLFANALGYDIPFSEIGNGTSIDSILEYMEKARTENKPLVLFSTYNSANRIELARRLFECDINVIINDEAHYLVQREFHKLINLLQSKSKYYFTATTIHTPSDEGRGMNNPIYGDVLYQKTPLEAIDIGRMLPIKVVSLDTDIGTDYTDEDYDKSINKLILESFLSLREKNTIGAKLLISVKGIKGVKSFLDSEQCQMLIGQGVNIFATTSNDEIGNTINGAKVSRQNFLKELKIIGNDDSKESITLHFDILSEGIDVSGFTGILLLRGLTKNKFLQNVGRVTRVHPTDRLRIDNGTLKPRDFDNYVKKFGYVYIPNLYRGNEDDREYHNRLIRELRSLGFNPSEDVSFENVDNGIPDKEEVASLNDVETRENLLGQEIDNIYANEERDRLANITPSEFLNEQEEDTF